MNVYGLTDPLTDYTLISTHLLVFPPFRGRLMIRHFIHYMHSPLIVGG